MAPSHDSGLDTVGSDGNPDHLGADLAPADVGPTDLAPPDAFVPTAPGTWVSVLSGTFNMGSPLSELCHVSDEVQHQVSLKHAFEIAATETTQTDYQAVMGYNPSYFKSCGGSCPVDTVSWREAAAYCNTLSVKSGLAPCYTCTGSRAAVTCKDAPLYAGNKIYACPGYRLPTEAEWEYAYRAGTKTAFYSGPVSSCWGPDSNADKIGWNVYNTSSQPSPVGKKQPNAWVIYDMAGNVWEWVHDWYTYSLGTATVTNPVTSTDTGGGKVVRGGACNDVPNALRAARRYNFNSTYKSGYIGFRCLRSK